MQPTIGRIVHYVSFGTPGGEYTSQCRAAIVTSATGVALVPGEVRLVEDGFDVGLCVLNPEGQFFNQHVPYDQWDSAESDGSYGPTGGTWHWPERVKE